MTDVAFLRHNLAAHMVMWWGGGHDPELADLVVTTWTDEMVLEWWEEQRREVEAKNIAYHSRELEKLGYTVTGPK